MVSMWCKYSQDSSKHVVSHPCNSVAFLCFIFSNKWREGVWSISGGFWKNTSELLMWIELPPFPYYQPLTPNCVACIVTVRRLSHNLSSGSINTKKKKQLTQHRSNTITNSSVLPTWSSQCDAWCPHCPEGWSETLVGHRNTSSGGGSWAEDSWSFCELPPEFQKDQPAANPASLSVHLHWLKRIKNKIINREINWHTDFTESKMSKESNCCCSFLLHWYDFTKHRLNIWAGNQSHGTKMENIKQRWLKLRALSNIFKISVQMFA